MIIKAGIFLNPNAGSLSWERKIERAERSVSRLARVFKEVEYRVYPRTESREEFQQLIRNESIDLGVLVAGGGDGTLSDVLNNASENCIVGHLKLGSGNNITSALYRHRLIGGEEIVDTDLLIDETDGKKCMFLGAGFDSLLMRQSDEYRAAQWKGSSRYIPSFIDALRSRKNRYQVRIDGASFNAESSKMIFVGKHPIAGSCIPVFPDAKFDDGKLYGITLNQYFLPKYIFQGKRIEVRSSFPMLIERDGEVIGLRNSFSVHVEKKARKLLTARL